MKKEMCLLLFLIFFVLGCSERKNPVEPKPEEKIKVGDKVEAASQAVGTGGANIIVNLPGKPINGLEINIPSNSFTSDQIINVSYAEVISHDFGEFFNPASPLIIITSNVGYANETIKIKVPVTLQPGDFAMGFLYDKTTEKLEGLAVEEIGENYVVVSTRKLNSNSSLGKRRDDVSEANLIISTQLESILAGHLVVSSGFEPGRDDWEFPNYGSFIAPTGHCSGQSLAAIWYYFEKRLRGEGDLYHKYDKITNSAVSPSNDVWMDNPKGYKFASVLQKTMNFDDWLNSINLQMENPKRIFYNFLKAMLVTGEPQLICIHSSAKDVGHAMIVYKIDVQEKKLFIADPNFPASKDSLNVFNERTIQLKDNKFESYFSGTTAANRKEFDELGYFGKSAFINLSSVKDKWTQFENGTIGNDLFPQYTLKIHNTETSITDGMTVTNKELKIANRSVVCDGWITGTNSYQPFWVFDSAGIYLGKHDRSGVFTFTLHNGKNKLGFFIMGIKETQGRKDSCYVDFKWLTINYDAAATLLTIEPANPNLYLNGNYTFSFNYTGTLPSHYRCYWFTYDDSKLYVVNDNTEFKHIFKKEGSWTIDLSLYDTGVEPNVKLGEASTKANITKGPLSNIWGTESLGLGIYGECEYDPPSDYLTFEFNVEDFNMYDSRNIITWEGTTFSCEYSYPKLGVVVGDTLFITGTVTGTISEDSQILETLSLTQKGKDNDTEYNYEFRISLVNVPLVFSDYGSWYTFSNNSSGQQIADMVSSVYFYSYAKDYYTQQWIARTLKSLNYNSTTITPTLRISFMK